LFIPIIAALLRDADNDSSMGSEADEESNNGSFERDDVESASCSESI
jgi:hypothetical protein